MKMESKILEKLKYPIGKFNPPDTITEKDILSYISDVEKLPEKIKKAGGEFFRRTIEHPLPA